MQTSMQAQVSLAVARPWRIWMLMEALGWRPGRSGVTTNGSPPGPPARSGVLDSNLDRFSIHSRSHPAFHLGTDCFRLPSYSRCKVSPETMVETRDLHQSRRFAVDTTIDRGAS